MPRPAGPDMDAVPADKGCNLHSSCLTCPFERCRYDTLPLVELAQPGPAGVAQKAMVVSTEVKKLYLQGLRPMAIADHLGISRRSVYRALERARRRDQR